MEYCDDNVRTLSLLAFEDSGTEVKGRIGRGLLTLHYLPGLPDLRLSWQPGTPIFNYEDNLSAFRSPNRVVDGCTCFPDKFKKF